MSQTITDVNVNASQKHNKKGTCSVCLRVLSLTAAGLIHSHGHGSPCAGTGNPPADISTTSNTPVSLCTTVCQPSEQSNPQHDAQSLLDIIITARVQVLKYVPKASRIMAAAKLTTVIDQVVANPDNVSLWLQLFLFTYNCFGVCERGGRRHSSSLATKVNKRLSEFTGQPLPQVPVVSNFKGQGT